MTEKFKKPKPAEVLNYALSLGYRINGQRFCDFYEQKGWVVGKSPMRSWRAAVRIWKINAQEAGRPGIFAPVSEEAAKDKRIRLLRECKCLTCIGGRLEKHEDGSLRCNQCCGDYTVTIMEVNKIHPLESFE
mgnify:CR=1 FL=1